jgi:hypothetical protein
MLATTTTTAITQNSWVHIAAVLFHMGFYLYYVPDTSVYNNIYVHIYTSFDESYK